MVRPSEIVLFLLSEGSSINLPASAPVDGLPLSSAARIRTIAAVQTASFHQSAMTRSRPERTLFLNTPRWRIQTSQKSCALHGPRKERLKIWEDGGFSER